MRIVRADHSFARDAFISHASEDKRSVARPLKAALEARGWTVWLDEDELKVGDPLTAKIDDALARSRYGVVVISKAFMSKHWPRRELEGLRERQRGSGDKVILPIWHGVTAAEIAASLAPLHDVVAIDTKIGIEAVATQLVAETSDMPPRLVGEGRPPSSASRRIDDGQDPKSATFNDDATVIVAACQRAAAALGWRIALDGPPVPGVPFVFMTLKTDRWSAGLELDELSGLTRLDLGGIGPKRAAHFLRLVDEAAQDMTERDAFSYRLVHELINYAGIQTRQTLARNQPRYLE